MQAKCPKQIVFQNRGLNYAGPGRAPGSHAYVDPGRGEVLELFFAEVVQVGRLFGLCRIANNTAMPSVRVDHGLLSGVMPLTVGQVLLVGPLTFEEAGPRAHGAWLANLNGSHRPGGAGAIGTVSVIKHGYGFIKPMDGTADAFFHLQPVPGL